MTDITVDALTRQLELDRAAEAARRADELARAQAEAEHARARADVDEAARLAEMARTEREADARAAAQLGRLMRETRAAGERARVAAAVARSGEARAVRLERTRKLNLAALVPVLAGFGAWSTAGVQQGGARLMDATTADPTWWALWALEPVLIGVVVWVIIARARLATTGGHMARGAERIAAAALAVSVALNLVAAAPGSAPESAGAVAALVGAMFAHAIGPVGAAATAYLIGVVDASVSAADPWAESGAPAPRMADLAAVESAPAPALPTASKSVPAAAVESTKSASETTPGSAVERASGVTAETRRSATKSAPAGTRKSTTKSTAKSVTDEQLRAYLDALYDIGELPADASVRAIQAALGIGFDRAKRIRDLRVEMPGQTAIDTDNEEHHDVADESRPLHAVAS